MQKLLGFSTADMIAAKASLLVYSIYRSRDKRRGPSGMDMWGQIERFARASAKRALSIGEFVNTFKRRMACDTINPRWMATGLLPPPDEYGEIIVHQDKRTFMPEIMECDDSEQRTIIDCIYRQTVKVVLLVRARIEDEKPIEAKLEASNAAE